MQDKKIIIIVEDVMHTIYIEKKFFLKNPYDTFQTFSHFEALVNKTHTIQELNFKELISQIFIYINNSLE